MISTLIHNPKAAIDVGASFHAPTPRGCPHSIPSPLFGTTPRIISQHILSPAFTLCLMPSCSPMLSTP